MTETTSVLEQLLEQVNPDIVREFVNERGLGTYREDEDQLYLGKTGQDNKFSGRRVGLSEFINAVNDYASQRNTDPGVKSQSTDTTQPTTGPVPVETTTTGDDNMTHDDTTPPRATPVTPTFEDDVSRTPISEEEIVERVYSNVVGRLSQGAKDVATTAAKGAVALGSVAAVTAAHRSGLVDVSEYGLEATVALGTTLLARKVANSRGWGSVKKSAAELTAAGIGFVGAEPAYATAKTTLGAVMDYPGYAAAAGVSAAALASAVAFPKARKPIAGILAGAGLIALCAGYGGDVVDAGSNFAGSAWDKVTGLFAHEEQADGEVSMYEDTLRELAAVGGEYGAIKETLDKALVQKYTGIEQARNAVDTTQSVVWLETCSPAELFGEVLQAPKDDELRATYDAVMADGYKWGAQRISEQFGAERLTQDVPCSYTFDNETAGQQ